MTREFQIVERIRKQFAGAGLVGAKWLVTGSGDDAAVLGPAERGFETVLSCDWFLEGVHFAPEIHPADAIGYKALARATSDLAAMGAVPKFFLLSLALPNERAGKWLDGLATGLVQAAREFGLVLAGGDTSRYSQFVASVTVGGEVQRGHALTRSGARPGDQIFVSGTLGAAQLGLELLRRSSRLSTARRLPELRPIFEAHLRPKPQIELGRWLAGYAGVRARRIASAAIDTSDGLSADLGHLCDASGVGARIWADKIPKVEIPPLLAKRSISHSSGKTSAGLNSLQLALHGGEDYQLLFTVPAKIAARIPAAYRGVRLSHVGETVRGSKIELIAADDKKSPILPGGWDSFAR